MVYCVSSALLIDALSVAVTLLLLPRRSLIAALMLSKRLQVRYYIIPFHFALLFGVVY